MTDAADARGPRAGRVLLLGATGFLGSHIDAALRADDRTTDVVGVAYGVPPGDPSLRDVDLVAVSGDQLDAILDEVRPDAVINAAGLTAGPPEALHALNTEFVNRLLGSLHRTVPAARLVHLGSAAEYGPPLPGRPTRETDETRPAGPYGESKLAATRSVWGASILGLDTVVLRVFNPIGAGMDRRTLPGNAARRLAEAVAAGEGAVQLGPLGAHRDFVAAGDVAAAVVAAVHRAPARGEILNVGSGRARQARELVAVLAGFAGFDGTVYEEAVGSSRSTAVNWMAADLTRTREVLGWEPVIPFEVAVGALWRSVAGAGSSVGAAAR